MKPPGFASSAPAPTIATAGDEATPPMLLDRGLRLRRVRRLAEEAHRDDHQHDAEDTSRIATHVFGLDGVGGGSGVAEDERGRDTDGERRRERAEQEPAAGAERPRREHEREHRERQRRRRQHRRERHENELGVDPAHAGGTLNAAPAACVSRRIGRVCGLAMASADPLEPTRRKR